MVRNIFTKGYSNGIFHYKLAYSNFFSSGKPWIYRYILKDLLTLICGFHTIKRNTLSFTDEDASEYKPFEDITSCHLETLKRAHMSNIT
jgi:hypothetical protein